MSNWFSKLFDDEPEPLTKESVLQSLKNARGFLIMDNSPNKILYLTAVSNAIKYLEGEENGGI